MWDVSKVGYMFLMLAVKLAQTDAKEHLSEASMVYDNQN